MKVEIWIPAPASLMLYGLTTYPQYGSCEYFFDGQVMKLLPHKEES